jgi:hypothetical protein
LSSELGIEDQIEKSWSSHLGNQDNCTNYLKKYILPAIDSPLVLGLDNIDEIFPLS